ncbi:MULTISPECIES: hypothetical protein [unclassified Nocardioides]|uniref:hypothetical protein n=1 Tax=unclassified Nocardioides TaxID=2615069 RepID=UPI0000EB607C|nr:MULTISPECIES: hypothetical protein [unclassified Nocardioides]ABL79330.1 hypothetical protein Noca_4744 [Nocardioides sp. JS614]
MTNALPNDATWTDYVNAHGGPEAAGWWVTLRWFADSVHPRPEVVGPYSSHMEAVAAMQDLPLIDGFAEDTNRDEWLDDVYVTTDTASIAKMCADYGRRVTLIDPGDPSRFGDPDPGPTPAVPSPTTESVPGRGGLLQAGALDSSGADHGRHLDDGVCDGVDRSPAPPTL